MNKITDALLPFVLIDQPEGPVASIHFAALKKDIPELAIRSLEPERVTDALMGYFKALYELNKLIFSAASRFFGGLFGFPLPAPKVEKQGRSPEVPCSPPSPPKTEKPEISPEVKCAGPVPVSAEARELSEASKLRELLKTTLKIKVYYSEDENPVELGTYVFDHLLDGCKGGVEFDPHSQIYTVRFPKEKRAPMIFSQETKERLKGRVQDPVVYIAKEVKFKVGPEKIELLGDSLTASATVHVPLLGAIGAGATIEALAAQAPDPFAETHMLASIRLNEHTHIVVRKFVNNVFDLSRVRVQRNLAIRTMHQTLTSQNRRP